MKLNLNGVRARVCMEMYRLGLSAMATGLCHRAPASRFAEAGSGQRRAWIWLFSGGAWISGVGVRSLGQHRV